MTHRGFLALLLFGTGLLLAPQRAAAAELHKHFLMGVRLGDFLPADEQKGGFRVFGGNGENSERAVKIEEVPTLSLSFGYGVAKLGKAQVVLELQVSRFEAGMGPETVYRDPDASTRVELPPTFRTGLNFDEEFLRLPVGEITLTPVFVNTTFHWQGGGGRADFYCGAGLGVVLAEVTESAEFRDFKSDYDGQDDLTVDDAFGLLIKVGSNVSLKRDGNWLMYFEAEFISTATLSSEGQVRWNGSDYFAGTQDVDTDGDNIDDAFGIPSDLRIVDPGKFRVDGATVGIGLRYRFGGKKAPAGAAAATEASVPSTQP